IRSLRPNRTRTPRPYRQHYRSRTSNCTLSLAGGTNAGIRRQGLDLRSGGLPVPRREREDATSLRRFRRHLSGYRRVSLRHRLRGGPLGLGVSAPPQQEAAKARKGPLVSNCTTTGKPLPVGEEEIRDAALGGFI